MVSARNLSKRYGAKRVFDRVDLRLDRGGALLVTGPNGSGKTTLLRILAGLVAPSGGELRLPDRALVGYLGHEPLLYRELTPLENLQRFGLWEVRHERVGTFSRGMQQRLGLCRVLLHDPQLVVLDEPFNALDATGAALLDATLEELRDRALVIATHEPGRVERLATDRLAFA